MATVGQWIAGARLRTLPLAIAPVLIGAGAALESQGGLSALVIGTVNPEENRPEFTMGTLLLRAFLALLVSLSLQIGSNYANDYSDGVRGTDDERVGPLRLTASGLVEPSKVKRAAFLCFGFAAVVGAILVIVSQAWWFIVVGLLAIAAAWFYTGGKHPYGYMAMGEIFVFVFFGLVATVGTMYAMVGTMSVAAWAGAVGIGSYACAVLMVNNLRDIPTDRESGKTTVASLLGDSRARTAYAALVAVPYLCLVFPILTGGPTALIAVLSLALVYSPLKVVLTGSEGQALIPPIKHTSLAALTYAALLGLGLCL